MFYFTKELIAEKIKLKHLSSKVTFKNENWHFNIDMNREKVIFYFSSSASSIRIKMIYRP